MNKLSRLDYKVKIIPKTVTAEIAAADKIYVFFFSFFFSRFILLTKSLRFTFFYLNSTS